MYDDDENANNTLKETEGYFEIIENINQALNTPKYKKVVLTAAKKDARVLGSVDKAWALQNSNDYYEIVQAALDDTACTFAKNDVLRYVNENEEWVKKNPKQYYEIALAAVGQNPMALEYVNKDWVGDYVKPNPENYYEIVQAAVNQNGHALDCVNQGWISKNSDKYEKIALKAVKKNGWALMYINRAWELKNSDKYEQIALVAVKQDVNVFYIFHSILRNNIKIAISSLISIDDKYSNDDFYDYSRLINQALVNQQEGTPCETAQNILLYLYMLSNEEVSYKSKCALFDFFIENFEDKSSYKSFYKNILEFYLILSKRYTDAFPKYKLLANLSDDDYEDLYTFLYLADQPALKIALNNPKINNKLQIKNFLNNEYNKSNSNITNYLLSYKVTMYEGMVKNNLFVIKYDKIRIMINPNQTTGKLENNLIELILSYLSIADLLPLYKGKPEAKLPIEYLNIDAEFGMQALVERAKLKDSGFLRYTVKHNNSKPIFSLLKTDLAELAVI